MCILQEYTTPEGKVLSRNLIHLKNAAFHSFVECRLLFVSMGNAIKFVKLQAPRHGSTRGCWVLPYRILTRMCAVQLAATSRWHLLRIMFSRASSVAKLGYADEHLEFPRQLTFATL